MKRANLTAALDKSDNGAAVTNFVAFDVRTVAALLGDVSNSRFAEIGFIGLNDFALTTKRLKATCAHCLTQAMHQEPSRFVADAQHAVDLMRANAFFGSRHKEQRGQPLGQRDFGTLEYGSDCDCELLTASRFIALIHAGTVRFAIKLGDFVLICIAAMGTNPTVGPNARFKPIAGFGFVEEDRVFE
jgi:hypothetical protein